VIRGRAATAYGDLMTVRGGIRVRLASSIVARMIDDGDNGEWHGAFEWECGRLSG
jgi:hypothetical protein